MTRKTLTVFIALLLIHYTGISQENIKVKRKDFKTSQKEGFKEAWKSVKDAESYFEEGPGTYDIARDHYLFAYQYNSRHAGINYKIGICYLFTEDKYKAIDYLLSAYNLDSDVSNDIHFYLGRAYHLVLEFEKAIEQYQIHKEMLAQNEESVEKSDAIEQVEKKIIECKHGMDIIQEPKRVIIQNLGRNINSAYDDYNPIFAYQDTALFFTSRRPSGKRADRNPIDNKFYEDIYISSIQEQGDFDVARRLEKPFNTKHNDALVGINPSGDKLYVYQGHVNGGDIEVMELRKNMQWKRPRPLSRKVRSDAEETTAAMDPDGDTLYFISSNPDLTRGGKDILYTLKDEKGKWTEPENAGGVLNTVYDEEGVYISNDGKTIYFASRGHNSMGGFDIFTSTKEEDGTWSVPENLGYPINTPDDEIFYVTDTSGIYGYYSAIREGGLGAKDIYKVIFLGSEKEMTTLTKDQLIAGIDIQKKSGFLTMPDLLEIDTSLLLTGRVRDTMGTDTTVMAGLTFMDPSTGEVVARAMTGQDGMYRAKLPEPKMYGVEINATGFLYYLDIVDLSELDVDEVASKDFFMQRIEVGAKVVLENIYFETGKAVLTSESYESLDQVYTFLDNNSSVRLEISGHTDNVGSLRVNTQLSRDRAKAVVDYLVGRGIESSRLEYKGYAFTQPIAPNDTPEGREQNRRVEFKVLSK